MQTLAEFISTYVRETRRLEGLLSSTETTFYPDLKVLLNAVLKVERLPFDVVTGTSEGGAQRRDMPDFVLGDSTLFVGVYGEVKRADTSLVLPTLPSPPSEMIRSAAICRKQALCFCATCGASGSLHAIPPSAAKLASPFRQRGASSRRRWTSGRLLAGRDRSKRSIPRPLKLLSRSSRERSPILRASSPPTSYRGQHTDL